MEQKSEIEVRSSEFGGEKTPPHVGGHNAAVDHDVRSGAPVKTRGRPRRVAPAAPAPEVTDPATVAAAVDAKYLARAQSLARSADFQEKWGEWLGYRRERGLPNTLRALKGQLKMIAQLHPNPDEAWHALDWAMTRNYEFPFPKPKAFPREPLPRHLAALQAAGLGEGSAARGGRNAPTTNDLATLEDYKRQAADLSPAERADLVRKCADTLPALSGSLSAFVWRLNEQDKRKSLEQKETKEAKEEV